MPRIRIGQQNVPLPANRFARLAVGLLLIIGGILGFLPVLGFWMVPLGLLVLSYDLPMVRRWRRRFLVHHSEWFRRRYPDLAEKLGLGRRNSPEAERMEPPAV
jgi:UPF0716 family protein affecting phage T7 exclusion